MGHVYVMNAAVVNQFFLKLKIFFLKRGRNFDSLIVVIIKTRAESMAFNVQHVEHSKYQRIYLFFFGNDGLPISDKGIYPYFRNTL